MVFVVGHDWGAFMAWSLCLYRPDKVKALVTLSVHFMPSDHVIKSIAMFRGLFGDDHYMCQFQICLPFFRLRCRNCELAAPWTKAQVKVPTKFIVGDLDLVYNIPGAKEYIHGGGMKVSRTTSIKKSLKRSTNTFSRSSTSSDFSLPLSCITDPCTSQFQMLASFMLC
ncbi:hypothetical protein RHGRI_003238 [Rhododendron griersonianum]|uniref:AB hydrolase-1 domain-containing protein n=1 Tax=Rhododendron griersonianum TaxID=479676 RepID=A0AAV6L661_9ERIC|nr:hypothetical protein RHGRI_003238 [Rhododendron griersonianum]